MQDADADAAATAGDAHEVADHAGSPDFVVHDEVLAVQAVFDIGLFALDVAEQVPIALAYLGSAVQHAGRVADDVVDDILGESGQRSLDIAVGFAAEVVFEDVVDRLAGEAGGCGHGGGSFRAGCRVGLARSVRRGAGRAHGAGAPVGHLYLVRVGQRCGIDGGFAAAGELQLAEDVADVVLRGLGGDHERAG